MRYKYPKCCEALVFERLDGNTVRIIDYDTGERYTADIDIVRFMKQLDGRTNPYSITRPQLGRTLVRKTLKDLLAFSLIRYTSTIRVSLGTVLRPLWKPGKSRLLRPLSVWANRLLQLLWLPVLILGIALFVKNILSMNLDGYYIGFLGVLPGLVLHEMAHVYAAVAYGARVFHAGVMVSYFIVPGGYVSMDPEPVKKRMHRMQIDAAGVEANLLLAGIFLLCAVVLPQFGGPLLCAAISNAVLAWVNLCIIEGLDGASVLDGILGCSMVVQRARELLFIREERKVLAKRKYTGKAVMAASAILFVMQLALPLMLVLSVLEVVACFF